MLGGRPEKARAHVNSKGKLGIPKTKKIICQTSKMCWYFISQVLHFTPPGKKTSNICNISRGNDARFTLSKQIAGFESLALVLVSSIDLGNSQMYLTQNGSFFFPASFRTFVSSRVFWGGEWSDSAWHHLPSCCSRSGVICIDKPINFPHMHHQPLIIQPIVLEMIQFYMSGWVDKPNHLNQSLSLLFCSSSFQSSLIQ